MLRLLSIACLVASATSAQRWPGLRTTFGTNPFGDFFYPQPRTIAEAEAEDSGWHKIGSCGDGGKFLGNRYIEQWGHSLILIFDDAGYIAGSQSMVRTLYVDESLADLSVHPAYQLDYLGDWEAYFTTAYFVDPEIICNGGRTEADFEQDGTGDRLLIQVGETPDMLVVIPQLEVDALTEPDWYEHKCFPGMGKHVIGFNGDPNQDCDEVMPLQILYHQGQLSGFVWQHNAQIPGEVWEHPDALAAGAIISNPPTCTIEHTKNPGLSTMHHYFLDSPWLSYC